jgi:carbon monoxide dehydrogenase subunit G
MTKQINQQNPLLSWLKLILKKLEYLGKWIIMQFRKAARPEGTEKDTRLKSAEEPVREPQKADPRSLMQRVEYVKTVDIPLEVMWDFIKDFNNWAPMLKGYKNHKMINEKESIWEIRGEFGSFSRLTKFHTTITEWVQPSKVAFELKGINEPVTGYGFVNLSPSNNGKACTTITSEAGFIAGGVMGPLINRMVKPWLSTIAEELVEKLIAAVNPNDFKSEYWQK